VNVTARTAGQLNGVTTIVIELRRCGLVVESTGEEWVVVGTIGECEIQTIGTAIELVYKKIISGNTNGGGTFTTAHGISDHNKIVSGRVQSNASFGDVWYWQIGAESFQLSHDPTNITFSANSYWNSSPVNIHLKYYI
jgi:hypothetical protein